MEDDVLVFGRFGVTAGQLLLSFLMSYFAQEEALVTKILTSNKHIFLFLSSMKNCSLPPRQAKILCCHKQGAPSHRVLQAMG